MHPNQYGMFLCPEYAFISNHIAVCCVVDADRRRRVGVQVGLYVLTADGRHLALQKRILIINVQSVPRSKHTTSRL